LLWILGGRGLWHSLAVFWVAGASNAKIVYSLLAHSPLEVLIWIGLSITAGICDEMTFRGYPQRHLHALSGSIVVAVVGQGLVSGLFHSYQGWKNVIVVSGLGVLYGALAGWRGNLRANIIVHAWADNGVAGSNLWSCLKGYGNFRFTNDRTFSLADCI
jgi:membrane protease YdiL (CAAX protease family)